MARRRLPTIDAQSSDVAARVASGLQKIGLAMKQTTWHKAAEEGLSATQGQILAAVVGGPLSGKELGERLGVSLPTISDSVRVLVEKGLVTKSADPRHPRASLVAPTARGKTLGARARSWPELVAGAVGTLTPDEQRAFFSATVKTIRALQEQGLVSLAGMCFTCTHFRPHVRVGATPHHCALVDAPLAADELRLDCPEHVLAEEDVRSARWTRFVGAAPATD